VVGHCQTVENMLFRQLLLLILQFVASGAGSQHQPWHQYVRGPTSKVISPAAVLHTHGDVSNADALITKDGVATLKRPSTADAVASITLDFGRNLVGFVRLHFAGASDNHPGIRLTFSETTEYLRNVSDFTRSDNGDAITPGTD